MPKLDKVENSDAKSTETARYYNWPAKYETPTIEMWEFLKNFRKKCQTEQQAWSEIQKDAWKDSPEWARFAKQESKYWLKLQRACTLMIPWFGPTDKGQKAERPKMWPADLASELDEVSGKLILLTYEKQDKEQVRREDRTTA